MEGLYLLARKVVEKRFPYDKDIQPLFIAALYGLLRKYKNYSNIVCDIFLQTDQELLCRPEDQHQVR